MARKRNKKAILPVFIPSDLYDRVREAARWQSERINTPNYGMSSLARQGIQLRVEEIEAERRALENAA